MCLNRFSFSIQRSVGCLIGLVSLFIVFVAVVVVAVDFFFSFGYGFCAAVSSLCFGFAYFYFYHASSNKWHIERENFLSISSFMPSEIHHLRIFIFINELAVYLAFNRRYCAWNANKVLWPHRHRLSSSFSDESFSVRCNGIYIASHWNNPFILNLYLLKGNLVKMNFIQFISHINLLETIRLNHPIDLLLWILYPSVFNFNWMNNFIYIFLLPAFQMYQQDGRRTNKSSPMKSKIWKYWMQFKSQCTIMRKDIDTIGINGPKKVFAMTNWGVSKIQDHSVI